MRKAEVIFGLVVLIFSAIFLKITFSFPRPMGPDVGMAFYPRLLLGVIFILVIIIIYSALTRERDKRDEKPLFDIKGGGFKRIVYAIALTVIYQQLLDWAGFLIITPVYLVIMMRILNGGKYRKLIVISVATTLLIYIVFQRSLKIPLPTGIFYN